MKLPELNVEELARLRMKECQGTLLGGSRWRRGSACRPRNSATA